MLARLKCYKATQRPLVAFLAPKMTSSREIKRTEDFLIKDLLITFTTTSHLSCRMSHLLKSKRQNWEGL